MPSSLLPVLPTPQPGDRFKSRFGSAFVVALLVATSTLVFTGTSAHAAASFSAIGVVDAANASAHTLVIEDNGGDQDLRAKRVTVYLSKGTTVTRNGNAAPFSALQPGDTVNLTGARDARKRLVASGVDATAKPTPDLPALPALGSSTPTTTTGILTITIMNFVFTPPVAVIPLHTLVLIHNSDGFAHTFSGAQYSTGVIAGGGSYGVTFTVPGTYRFFCKIHPFMNGLLNVR